MTIHNKIVVIYSKETITKCWSKKYSRNKRWLSVKRSTSKLDKIICKCRQSPIAKKIFMKVSKNGRYLRAIQPIQKIILRI